MTALPGQTTARHYLELYRCEVCRKPVDQHAADHGCDWFGLSPLIAWTLVTALEIQGDQWPSIAGDLNVPPCAHRLVNDEAFCERMKASAHYLADQLAAGRADAVISRCTADEVNLAMAKIHVVDSGVAARLLRLTSERLAGRDSSALTELGHLLETFVVGEIRKQASWMDGVAGLGHWRTSDGDEVDLIVERDDGAIVAIEVKTSSRVTSADLKSLEKLREAVGTRFIAGAALYLGERSYTYGDRIHVLPVDRIWAP